MQSKKINYYKEYIPYTKDYITYTITLDINKMLFNVSQQFQTKLSFYLQYLFINYLFTFCKGYVIIMYLNFSQIKYRIKTFYYGTLFTGQLLSIQ